MDMYPRLCNPLKSKSFILIGSRGTGKSTFLKAIFSENDTLWIDFLTAKDEDRFSSNPDTLFDIVTLAKNPYEWVIIDEVQKVPKILDVIHRILESKIVNTKFALTGSSARKLKKGAANLLAGRAISHFLFPFTVDELGSDFNLEKALNFGLLPTVWTTSSNEEIKEYLRSYTDLYIKEEIWLEQLIKNLVPFRKFLEVSSQMNGEIINFSKIARQIDCDVKTVQNYFQILEDTNITFTLEAYHTSIRKRLISSPKFYFFDIGIKRALERSLNLEITPNNFTYGKHFEHFLIIQMFFCNHYKKLDYQFFYLKTKDGAEIDLIIDRPGEPLAIIEIKSTSKIEKNDFQTLIEFKRSLPNAEAFCLSQDTYERVDSEINIMPWQKGLKFLKLI